MQPHVSAVKSGIITRPPQTHAHYAPLNAQLVSPLLYVTRVIPSITLTPPTRTAPNAQFQTVSLVRTA